MSKGDKPIEIKHSKKLILESKLFTGVEKDILSTILDGKKEYSISDCINLLKKEKTRMVK